MVCIGYSTCSAGHVPRSAWYSTSSFKNNPGLLDDQNTSNYPDVSKTARRDRSPFTADKPQVQAKGCVFTRIGPACRIEFSTFFAGHVP